MKEKGKLIESPISRAAKRIAESLTSPEYRSLFPKESAEACRMLQGRITAILRAELKEAESPRQPSADCLQCGAPLKDGKCLVQPWHTAELREISQHPVPAPQQFKHYPKPWEFREEGCNGGPGVFDAAGSSIVALFWPLHPVEETAEAEQETYALGRAIVEIGKGEHPVPAPPMSWESFKQVMHLIETAEKLLEWMPLYSKGSSGNIRQANLRAAIEKFKVEHPEPAKGGTE